MTNDLTWSEFERVELRVGTVQSAAPNAHARKPAFVLTIDFGTERGVLKSSAQITDHYEAEKVVGTQVVAVVNFPPKQIARTISECLVIGALDQSGVVLLRPDQTVPNGTRIA